MPSLLSPLEDERIHRYGAAVDAQVDALHRRLGAAPRHAALAAEPVQHLLGDVADLVQGALVVAIEQVAEDAQIVADLLDAILELAQALVALLHCAPRL